MVSREREALEKSERLNELRSRHNKLALLLESIRDLNPSSEYEQLQKKYLREYVKLAMKKLNGMILIEEYKLQLDILNDDFQVLAEDIDMIPEENTIIDKVFITASALADVQ